MKKNIRTATDVDVFVGTQLKALRKSAKWSQTELAKKVGVTFQQIQKYERGTNRIGASRLWDFCLVFGVKPGQFFDGLETSSFQPNISFRPDAKPNLGNIGSQLGASEPMTERLS